MKLGLKFLGISLDNPLVLASGILGTTGASLAAVAAAGAGATTSKTIWLTRHTGHANPTVIHLGGGNCINAVGLPHGGLNEARVELENFRRLCSKPFFASVTAGSVADFAAVVAAVAQLSPDLIELNISCPNVEDELGRPFACEPHLAEQATRVAKKAAGEIPLAVKLSPNVYSIAEVAKAVEAAGADAITAINTVGPGMLIDIEARRPVLANRVGGLSGPAIRPVAVRCVADIYRAVRIPIIATGGVATGRDAIEMIQAGATLVAIGSAVTERGAGVFDTITTELSDWLTQQKIRDWSELRGVAVLDH